MRMINMLDENQGLAFLSPWMTIDEAATYLRMDSKTLSNYISRGLVSYYHQQNTGILRFNRDDLDSWLMQGRR